MAAVDTQPRTLISQAQLARPLPRALYWLAFWGLVIVIFTLVFIGPLYCLVCDGLKSTQEMVQAPPTIIPPHLDLWTYGTAWSRVGIGRLLFNTRYYALGALALQLVFDVAAAYAFSKLRPVLGNAIFRDAGHADDPDHRPGAPAVPDRGQPADPAPEPDRHPVGHLAAVGGERLQHLPAETVLRLDPAGRSSPRPSTARGRCGSCARSSCRCRGPILGVVSIFAVVAVWKDFLWPLLVENGTPRAGKRSTSGSAGGRHHAQNLIIAASAIAAVPTIVFFLIFQRNIMSGLTAGGLKG